MGGVLSTVMRLLKRPAEEDEASEGSDGPPSAKRPVLECVVCYYKSTDGDKDWVTLRCGHYFCLECINMMLHLNQQRAPCPLCRRIFIGLP